MLQNPEIQRGHFFSGQEPQCSFPATSDVSRRFPDHQPFGIPRFLTVFTRPLVTTSTPIRHGPQRSVSTVSICHDLLSLLHLLRVVSVVDLTDVMLLGATCVDANGHASLFERAPSSAYGHHITVIARADDYRGALWKGDGVHEKPRLAAVVPLIDTGWSLRYLDGTLLFTMLYRPLSTSPPRYGHSSR